MKREFSRKYYLPLIINLAILSGLILLIVSVSLSQTGGKFIYAIDDAYIHLAYAKNFVFNGINGINKYETSSAISSPLWTGILVLYFFMFGLNEYLLLILNIISSFLLLYVIFRFLKQHSVNDLFTGLVIFTVIVLLPLPIHIFTGMEHLFHAVLALLFIGFAAKLLSNNNLKKGYDRTEVYLIVISFFITILRYESFFLILIVSVLFLIRKNYKMCILISAMSMILPFVFSLIFSQSGGYVLPNSIMIKKSFFGLNSLFSLDARLSNYFNESRKIIFLFAITVLMFILQFKQKKNFWSEIPLLLFIVMMLIVIQKIAINIAYFRYDAYLVVLSITVNALAIYDYYFHKYKTQIDFSFFRKNLLISLALILFLSYFTFRQLYSPKTITAMKNIYEQQYQMSKFADKFYKGKGIALNDVGAVNYFADIRCLDLIGLASNEIAGQRIEKTLDSGKVKQIAKSKDIKIAIVYDKWIPEEITIPSEWIKAGIWKIQDNYICGDDEVSIYAVDKSEKENLINNLKLFSNELPPTVIQSGEYVAGESR